MSIPPDMKKGDKLTVEIAVDTKTFLGVLKGSKVVTIGAE